MPLSLSTLSALVSVRVQGEHESRSFAKRESTKKPPATLAKDITAHYSPAATAFIKKAYPSVVAEKVAAGTLGVI